MRPDTFSGSFALDSGVLIEMLLGSSCGQIVVESLLSESIIAYMTRLNLCEAEYVLCRRLGRGLARSKAEDLARSNYVAVNDAEDLHATAAEIKCERALPLGDCYSLANAKLTNSKALFAFREKDVTKEMRKKPFDFDVLFLEDITVRSTR